METLAYTHSYASYEEIEGIEYDFSEVELGWHEIPNSAWLSLLSVAVLLGGMGFATPTSAALYVKTGGSCLNARTGPSVSYPKQKCVRNGAKLLPVVGEGYDNAGNKWYKLSSGRWIMAKYTTNNSSSTGNNTGANPSPTPIGGRVVLRLGSRGDGVKALQRHLDKNFYNVEVDGFYGENTAKAVRQYQINNDLFADGIAGGQTLKHMGLN